MRKAQIAAIFLPTELDVIRRYFDAVSLFNEGNRFSYEGIEEPFGPMNWVRKEIAFRLVQRRDLIPKKQTAQISNIANLIINQVVTLAKLSFQFGAFPPLRWGDFAQFRIKLVEPFVRIKAQR